MGKEKITLAAVFYNEEEKLDGYFANLKGVVGRMVVVDCSSTDRTAEICQRAGAKVIKSPIRYFEQNIATVLAAVETEWVLIVSADERLSPKLKEELVRAVDNAGDTDIFSFKRVNYFYDGFSTASTINRFENRLFRKGHVYWERGIPHERETLLGKVSRLNGLMYHYSHISIQKALEKTYDYICRLPSEFEKKGQTTTRYAERDSRVSFIFGRHGFRTLILFPIFQVFNHLIRHRMILDGYRGLVHSVFSGVYAFLEEAAYWEISSKRRQGISIDWKREYPDRKD